MRSLAYFLKTFRENLREWKILIMALVFGPFFIYIMNAYSSTSTPRYTILVINHDSEVQLSGGEKLAAGNLIVNSWQAEKYPDGKSVFSVLAVKDVEAGKKKLQNRDADLLAVIPADFSRRLSDTVSSGSKMLPEIQEYGDPSNVRFMVAASFADYLSISLISRFTKWQLPLNLSIQPISSGRGLSDFDLYVPALLVLALIMVLFTAAASIIKEVDKGTIIRLQLSRISTAEFLGAISVNQVLISTAALALTFLAALHVGYRTSGSIFLFLFVGSLGSLSVIAISLIVAAFLKTIFELLTVGIFPFFILMFFSESMIPLPRLTLFVVFGHTYYVNDLLPTSLAVRAFNKILNFQAGMGDIGFELAGILLLTCLYFAIGVWLFRRRHMRIN